MKARRSRFRAALAGGMLVLAVAGCADLAVPSERPSGSGALPSSRPTPIDPLVSIATGPWQPVPVPAPTGSFDRIDVTCRVAGQARSDVRTAVIDVRGGGLLVFVFAVDTQAGTACLAPIDATSGADVEAWALEPAGEAPGPEAVDVLFDGILGTDPGASRRVVIGRVSPRAVRVLAQRLDGTQVEATVKGGWYGMWWPGTAEATVVSALDFRNQVIGEAVPGGIGGRVRRTA